MAGNDLEFALRLTADGTGFVGTMKVSRDEVAKLGQESRSAGGDVDALGDKMTGAVTKGNLLADAIKGTVRAIFDFVAASIEAGDKLNDLSIGTGRSLAELQALEIVAAKNGGTLQGLLHVTDFVAKGMSKGGDETNKFQRALDFFGVSAVDAAGKTKTAEQVASDLAKAYVEGDKSASAMAAAQFALGANFEQNIPQLIALADKQKELNSLRQFGALVDKNLAEASDHYNDTLVDVHSVMKGIGNDLARTLLPLMQSLADWFVRSATEGGILQGVIGALGGAITAFVQIVKAGVTALIALDTIVQMAGKTIGALIAAITNPSKAKTIWGEYKDDIAAINAEGGKALTSLWTSIEKVDEVNKEAGKPSNGKLFFSGRIKKEKDDVEDLTAEILKQVQALEAIGNEMMGVTTTTKNWDAAYAKLTADLLAGKRISTEQIDTYLNNAQALDDWTDALKIHNKETKDAQDLAKAEQKAIEDATKEIVRRYDATRRMVTAAQENNDSLRQEIATLGLSIPEQIHLNEEYERRKIALMDIDPAMKQMLLNLSKEREQLLLQKQATQQNVTAWNDLVSAMTNGVQNFIKDVLEGSWSSAFKKLWQNVLGWALDTFAKIASQQIVLNFTGSVGSTAGGLLSNIGGSAGGIGNIGSMLSTAGNVLGLGAGGLTGTGSLIGAAGAFVDVLSTGAPIMQAATMAFETMALTLGTVVPVVGAIVAAGYLLYKFLGSKGGGPKSGGFATTGDVPGIMGTDSSGRWFTPNDQDAGMRSAVQGINDQYTSILKALGGTGSATFAQGFSRDPKGTAPSNVHTGVWVNGQQVFDNPNGNVGRSDEDLQAELQKQSMQAILAALQASDLPAVVDRFLDSINASTASADEIQAALQQAAHLKDLADQVAQLPEFLANGLLDALGTSDEIDMRIEAFAGAFKAFWDAAGELGDAIARDPVDEALHAIADASATTYEKVFSMRDALELSLDAYDGTTEGTRDLTTAMNAFRDAQVEALVEIDRVSKAVAGMFADAQRQFDLALLSPDEKEQFFAQEALKTIDLLKQTTDPARIQELSSLINDDLSSALGLIDPEKQRAEFDRLRQILTDAQQAAANQLDLAENAVATAGTQTSDLIANLHIAVQEAADKQYEAAQLLIDAADAQRTAAQQNAEAAATQTAAAQVALQAAQTPVEIAPIEVNVNLNGAQQTVNG